MDEIAVIEIAPGEWAVTGAGQYQPHDPDLPGFVPMNHARAEEVAAEFRARLAASAEG